MKKGADLVKLDQPEMVDVVDPDNNVLYQTSKQKTHELGLLHRTVIAEVIDSKGRWTLVKQASDRQDANQFVSPVGGHVQAGESVEAALKREAFEEMGLKDFEYKYIGKVIFNRHVINRQENHFFLVYEIYTDADPVINHEAVDTETYSLNELKNQIKSNPKKFGAAFHFVVKTFYPKLLT